MMINFSKENLIILEHLKNFCGVKDVKLDITVKPDWRSSVEDHRVLIRKAVLEKYNQYIPDRSVFFDLNLVPKLTENFLSISHSNDKGGFVVANYPVGFDLIEQRRLNRNVIQRVSRPDEMERAPNPFFLWPAKEAAFKACSDHLSVITEIEIGSWEKLVDGFFAFKMMRSVAQQQTFDLMNSRQINRGFVFISEEVLYGIYFR